jgi:hypothetical protein
MKNGKDKILEISNKVFYGMGKYSQLIIDLVQEIEAMYDEEYQNHENFAAKNYDIILILEIIDPIRLNDVEVLNELDELLKKELEKTK